MIHDNLSDFNGKKVQEFKAGTLLSSECAIKVGIDWDEYDEGVEFTDKLKEFFTQPNVEKVDTLVIGLWAPESEPDSSELVKILVENKDKLPNLKGLMVGDIVGEEQEISWIEQSDLGVLLLAFPQLTTFHVRGGTGLRISDIRHSNLLTLIIETGGLSAEVLNDIAISYLPNLEHLELWLGEHSYGFDGGPEDVQKVLKNFEDGKLKYLGLRNSEIIDQLTPLVCNSPVINGLETLDLSLGTMSDESAKVILESSALLNLKFLNLEHHFISDAVVAQLTKLPYNVNVSDQQEDDVYDGEVYRYISVGE